MKKDDCIFCKIAAGEIPSRKVYEDEKFLCFLDLGPAAAGHTLVVPKDHYDDLFEMDEDTLKAAIAVAQQVGAKLKTKLHADGLNLVQNNGEAAGQTVRHFHIHLIPRYAGGPVIAGWTPGEPAPEELDAVLAKIQG